MRMDEVNPDFVAAVEAADDLLAGRSSYMEKMYEAFRRECRLPIERICLVELETDMGVKLYRFMDVRALDVQWPGEGDE